MAALMSAGAWGEADCGNAAFVAVIASIAAVNVRTFMGRLTAPGPRTVQARAMAGRRATPAPRRSASDPRKTNARQQDRCGVPALERAPPDLPHHRPPPPPHAPE